MAKSVGPKNNAVHAEVVKALQASQAINFSVLGDAIAKVAPKLLFADSEIVEDDYIINVASSIIAIYTTNHSPPPPPPPPPVITPPIRNPPPKL